MPFFVTLIEFAALVHRVGHQGSVPLKAAIYIYVEYLGLNQKYLSLLELES